MAELSKVGHFHFIYKFLLILNLKFLLQNDSKSYDVLKPLSFKD